MFKVGQMIKIKNDIESFLEDAFLEDERRYSASDHMKTFENKVFKIKEINYCYKNCYLLQMDQTLGYYWHENWLELVGNSEEEFE